METEIRVLFASPYSGCRCYSGWQEITPGGAKLATNVWPAQRNAPGAILCADRYHKAAQTLDTLTASIALAQNPVPRGAPTQGGRFLVSGPSSSGPFTVANISGGTYDSGPKWGIGGRGSSHSLGLT